MITYVCHLYVHVSSVYTGEVSCFVVCFWLKWCWSLMKEWVNEDVFLFQRWRHTRGVTSLRPEDRRWFHPTNLFGVLSCFVPANYSAVIAPRSNRWEQKLRALLSFFFFSLTFFVCLALQKEFTAERFIVRCACSDMRLIVFCRPKTQWRNMLVDWFGLMVAR